MEWTGGCLCGAIRYRVQEAPRYASYCHCGMCRKATGAPFAGFVEVPREHLEWTDGSPTPYESSEGVIRRFCATCGGSLTFETDEILFVTLGSVDEPESIKVFCHTYAQFRLPDLVMADGLPNFLGSVNGKGGRPID